MFCMFYHREKKLCLNILLVDQKRYFLKTPSVYIPYVSVSTTMMYTHFSAIF